MTSTATAKDLEKQLKAAEDRAASAESREQAATARAQELGSFQGQAATLTDRNAELERQVADLSAANEQLDRDAKAARAEAQSAVTNQGAGNNRVAAAEQLAAALKAFL